MKISTKGEYGIRAMLYLAMHAGEGPLTSHEIAVHQDIPEPYLRQILALLSRDGLVQSNRGPQGGHLLGRPGEEIALKDVLLTLEGQTTPIDHILSLPCSIEVGTAHCVIREVYLEIKRAVEQILEETTLADMAARQRRILVEGTRIPRDLEEPAALPVVRG